MNADARNELIYQIRTGQGKSPEDIVTELTQAVWRALTETRGLGNPDPHRWPALYSDFLAAFQKRLMFYAGCGTGHECRFSLNVYAPCGEAPPAGPTYILLLKGGLIRFVNGLADMAWRRFRAEAGSTVRRRGVRDRLQGALHRALSPYLYYNEGCSACRTRSGRPEHQIWRST